MRRRSLLRVAGTAAVGGTVALAGCAALTRPDLRAEFSVGVLHPADEQYVVGGLRPGGDARVFATAAADSAPERVGADAGGPVADTLRNPGIEDKFHVVVQLRSTPAAPRGLAFSTTERFSWQDRSTLRVRLVPEPWGSLADVEPDDSRRALRSADELVYTVVWSVVPAVDPLPETVEPVLSEG